MLANGSPLETVDNLPLSDAKALFSALQLGLIWAGKDYAIASTSLSQGNGVQQAIYQTHSPKYKPSPSPTLADLFPSVEKAMSLSSLTKKERDRANEELQAKKAAVAVVDSGAPEWLRKAVTGDN